MKKIIFIITILALIVPYKFNLETSEVAPPSVFMKAFLWQISYQDWRNYNRPYIVSLSVPSGCIKENVFCVIKNQFPRIYITRGWIPIQNFIVFVKIYDKTVYAWRSK